MTAHQRLRQQRLLAHLRQQPPGATLSTTEASRLYTDWGIARQKRIARLDLRDLADSGQLTRVPGHDTAYRLNHAAKERAA